MLRLCMISGRAFQIPEIKKEIWQFNHAFTRRRSRILSYRIIWQSPVAKVKLLIFQEYLYVRWTWNQKPVSDYSNKTILRYTFSLYSQVKFIFCLVHSFESMCMDWMCKLEEIDGEIFATDAHHSVWLCRELSNKMTWTI